MIRAALRTILAFVTPAFAFAGAASAETPCALDAPCEVAGGEYAIAVPEGWDGATPLPALVFYHGHNSSMESALRSHGLREAFIAHGWMVIAPNGAPNEDGVRRWPARPDADWRNDMAFTDAVLEDVVARAPIVGKPVVAGFSAGGSMAWMYGCYEGDKVSAVISVAGALRRPAPDVCPGKPPRALHVHGFSDAQVPFEGRGIRDWHQGDVHETLAIFRATHDCRSNPDAIEIGEGWRSRRWICAEGLFYLEHDGGHGLPQGWAAKAAEWIATGQVALE